MVWFSLVWTPGYGSTTRSTNALAPVTISLTGQFKFSQSAAMAGQLIHYHQYHGSAKNVYDVIFSSLQMMGIGKYHCTGWPDEHSNIQWTTQCSLSSQVHCASMCMMAITRKLHLLHFSTNEGMASIPEKRSGRYTHLGPMWFPNAADFQNWGYTLNPGNLASQAPPMKKKRLFWGGKTQKKSAKIFWRLLDTH